MMFHVFNMHFIIWYINYRCSAKQVESFNRAIFLSLASKKLYERWGHYQTSITATLFDTTHVGWRIQDTKGTVQMTVTTLHSKSYPLINVLTYWRYIIYLSFLSFLGLQTIHLQSTSILSWSCVTPKHWECGLMRRTLSLCETPKEEKKV